MPGESRAHPTNAKFSTDGESRTRSMEPASDNEKSRREKNLTIEGHLRDASSERTDAENLAGDRKL